jgi:hypothetical protein
MRCWFKPRCEPPPAVVVAPVVTPVVKPVHRTWRRVILSLFGISLISLHWRWAVNHIYSLTALHDDAAIVAFTSITQSAMYAISAMVVFLVTGLTFFSWSQSTSLTANLAQEITKVINDKDK